MKERLEKIREELMEDFMGSEFAAEWELTFEEFLLWLFDVQTTVLAKQVEMSQGIVFGPKGEDWENENA